VRLVDRLAGVSQRHPALALLVAAVPIMAVEASFGPDGNTGGWERLTYVVFFLYGYLLPPTAGSSTPCDACGGGRWGARYWWRSCWPWQPRSLTHRDSMR
jgi:hypothetical protein